MGYYSEYATNTITYILALIYTHFFLTLNIRREGDEAEGKKKAKNKKKHSGEK